MRHGFEPRILGDGALESAARGGGRQVERRRARIPKSRQGRPKVAHGFNRGLRVENGQSPGGAKEKMGLDRCVVSSLTGLVLYSRHNPAMNRRAIFERPCGTWNHDSLNTYAAVSRLCLVSWSSDFPILPREISRRLRPPPIVGRATERRCVRCPAQRSPQSPFRDT